MIKLLCLINDQGQSATRSTISTIDIIRTASSSTNTATSTVNGLICDDKATIQC